MKFGFRHSTKVFEIQTKKFEFQTQFEKSVWKPNFVFQFQTVSDIWTVWKPNRYLVSKIHTGLDCRNSLQLVLFPQLQRVLSFFLSFFLSFCSYLVFIIILIIFVFFCSSLKNHFWVNFWIDQLETTNLERKCLTKT